MIADKVTKCFPICKDGRRYIYEINDLEAELVLCKRCGRRMLRRDVRIRKIKDSSGNDSCILEAPRYACKCGSTRIMHPFFLAMRKRFSLVAIQEIVSADSYGNRRGIVSDIGSANVGNSRRWVVDFLWTLHFEKPTVDWPDWMAMMVSPPTRREEQRTFIHDLYKVYGDDWLLVIVCQCFGIEEIDLHSIDPFVALEPLRC